ncbi:MAG TPA: gamma-glutamyl-gamma-aminobutyrate hydrolase family protein, partial [Stellaceae bacterium]|nr:gamma-glutamyl-gamma-aminobutyrate hydrolase family protein [Stellaceae bacterium]
MSVRTPLVGIPTCFREVNERVMFTAVVRYPHAVVDAAGCLPMLIPSIGDKLDIDALLDTIDGLLLTGSPSNVEPFHYKGPPSREGTLHDP